MELWQGARQIASLAAAAKWADPPTDLLFVAGNAFVSYDLEGNLLVGNPVGDGATDFTPPFARVELLSSVPDPDSPGRFSSATYRLWVTAGSGGIAGTPQTTPPNDSHGIKQETGELRDPTQGAGKSRGRSVDEIVDRLLEVLGLTGLPGQLVDSIHGLQGEVVQVGSRVAVDGVEIVARPIDIVVYNATASRYYHAPFRPSSSLGADGRFTILGVQLNLWTFTVTANGTPVTLTAGIDFVYSLSTPSITATNLANAINANGTLGPLVTATANGADVNVEPDPGTVTLTVSVAANGGTPSQATATNTKVATLSWTAGPTRFDSFSYVVRRGTNPGDPAPTDPVAGGASVPLTGATTAKAFGLTAGSTYNFSIFGAYDEVAAGSAQRWSTPITLAVAT